jgi:hypothetical protein
MEALMVRMISLSVLFLFVASLLFAQDSFKNSQTDLNSFRVSQKAQHVKNGVEENLSEEKAADKNAQELQQKLDKEKCFKNMRKIEAAIEMYNMDHNDPIKILTPDTLEQLVNEKYLEAMPVCPAGGIYGSENDVSEFSPPASDNEDESLSEMYERLDQGGKIKCTVHGAL